MTFIDPDPKPEATPADGDDGFAEAFACRSAEEEQEAEPKMPTDEEGKPADALPASEAAAEPAAAQNGSFDPFAGMNPEQKAHWERVQHSDQSQRGRVAALQRKVQTETAQPAPITVAKTEADAYDGKAKTGDDLDAKMKAAAEEYPDAVGPFVEIITAMKTQIADLLTKVQPIADDRSEAELTAAYGVLAKAHPDFAQIAEDPKWAAWIETQPKEIQTLANSFDPEHVSSTIKLFKLENGQASHKPLVDTATEDKRKRQLDSSKDVSATGVPSASGVPNDFDAAFKARAKSGA